MTTPADGPHTDPEGDRHDRPRHQLGNLTEDGELLARLGDVLDRVDPTPPGLLAAGRAVFTADTAPADASAGVPRAPAEAPQPAGGATGPIPAAPPAHHLRLTPRQRVLQRLLDLIGRPAS